MKILHTIRKWIDTITMGACIFLFSARSNRAVQRRAAESRKVFVEFIVIFFVFVIF